MKTHFNIEFLESSTEKLKAIAHPIRFVIIDLLYRLGEQSVSDIHENLEIEQAVTSHHLRILKNQNIVKVTRDGKNSLYSLVTTDYYQIVSLLFSAK